MGLRGGFDAGDCLPVGGVLVESGVLLLKESHIEGLPVDELPGSIQMALRILEPNDGVEPNDRMPVVLPRNDEDRWLVAGPADRRDLCRHYSEDDLEAYPLSTMDASPIQYSCYRRALRI